MPEEVLREKNESIRSLEQRLLTLRGKNSDLQRLFEQRLRKASLDLEASPIGCRVLPPVSGIWARDCFLRALRFADSTPSFSSVPSTPASSIRPLHSLISTTIISNPVSSDQKSSDCVVARNSLDEEVYSTASPVTVSLALNSGPLASVMQRRPCTGCLFPVAPVGASPHFIKSSLPGNDTDARHNLASLRQLKLKDL
ncbi:unnamed protein product [Protopolystoma xenopodis]|uniref:Uncharacterized protein n=1 Tax=Protopolystoma xenopodis TaxID=117903 RepID=A0A448WJL2_9PLAT|nr:unnamed protein product [Protopolystoma xenopodis]